MEKNTAEILREAAGRVRLGWTRWLLRDGRKVCAMGGICMASGVNRVTFPDVVPVYQSAAAEAVVVALQLPISKCDSPGEAIANWNNADGQTAENVAAGLEYAALLWEQAQAANAGATPIDSPQGESAHRSSLSSSVLPEAR